MYKQPPLFFKQMEVLSCVVQYQRFQCIKVQPLEILHKCTWCEVYGKTIKLLYNPFHEYNFLTTRRIYMKLYFLESSRGNIMIVSIWISFRALLLWGWCKINGEVRKIVVRKVFKKMIGQTLYGFSIIMERLLAPCSCPPLYRLIICRDLFKKE